MRHKRIQTTMVYADASEQMQADALLDKIIQGGRSGASLPLARVSRF